MKHHLLVCVFKTGTCQKTLYHLDLVDIRDSFGHFSCRYIEDISLSFLYAFHREKREKIMICKKIIRTKKIKKGKRKKNNNFLSHNSSF